MATKLQLDEAFNRVKHNGKVAQRLWSGSFIEVLTIDSESRKVMSITLDKTSAMITFKVFDRLLERDVESTSEVLNRRQVKEMSSKLESEYWPETEYGRP